MNTRSYNRGFTTFEVVATLLLTVIAAGVAYLALRDTQVVGAPRLAEQAVTGQVPGDVNHARRTAARLDASNLLQGLRLYKLDRKQYPTQAEGLQALVSSPQRYVERLPEDPWGRQYHYANPGARAEVEVFSAGPDGVPGTDDDIGSWSRP